MIVLKLTIYYIRTGWRIRTLIFLLAMLLLTGFILWGLPHFAVGSVPLLYKPVSLSIVDDDRSLISRLLIDELSDIEMIDQIFLETLPAARKRLSAAETAVIVVIPTGFFEQTTYSLERSPLLIYRSGEMPAETAVLTRLFDHLAEGITAVQAAFFAYREYARPLYAEDQAYFRALDAVFLRLFFKMLGRKSFTDISEDDHLQTDLFFVSAMISLLTLLTALLNLLQVQQDRRSHLQVRLFASGLGWFRCFLARQLSGTCWLIAGFAPLMAGLHVLLPQMNMLRTAAAVLLLYWVAGAWFQAWGQIGSSSDEKLLVAWLILLLMLLLGGCIYPSALLPDRLQPLVPLSPAWFACSTVYHAAVGRQVAMPWFGWLVHMTIATLLVWLSGRKSRRRARNSESSWSS